MYWLLQTWVSSQSPSKDVTELTWAPSTTTKEGVESALLKQIAPGEAIEQEVFDIVPGKGFYVVSCYMAPITSPADPASAVGPCLLGSQDLQVQKGDSWPRGVPVLGGWSQRGGEQDWWG